MYILFLAFALFSPFVFAGCGQADMNRAVQQLLSEARTYYKVPGVQISVLCPGESTPRDFVGGYADVEQNIAMSPQHLLQVGSETKSFIAVILLQLEQEGKLSIYDPIGNYLKDIPTLWQSVTIEQILNHTSGIPDYLRAPSFVELWKKGNGSKLWTDEELIALVRDTPPVFHPGMGWDYSQTNYILAGRLIEVITDNTLESELDKRVFMPLHLKNTVYAAGTYDEALQRRMAHGYSESGLFPRERTDVTGYNLSWLGSAGAMLSTAHDKAIWMKSLLTTDILSPMQKQKLKYFVDMDTGRRLPALSPKYGYGTGVIGWHASSFGPLLGGLGKTLGYYTATIYLECHDIVISATFNHFGKQETDGAGVRLLLFKTLNTIEGFSRKRCSNVKIPVELEDTELFKATNFDTFDLI